MKSPKVWTCPSWSLDSNPVKYHELYHTILLTCITNGLLILPTIALNGVIIITIVKTRTLQSASNWFLGNLMLTGLLMGVFAQPLYIVTKDWSLKGLLINNCEVGIAERFFAKTLPLTLMLTLTASSLDRYLAIRLMLQYRAKMTSFRVILIIICLWSFALIGGCLVISMRQSLGSVLFLAVMFVVCLVVTFIAYFNAFHGLRRHQNQVSCTSDNLTCINVKKYQRSFTTMLCVFLLQLVFYTPDICANFVSAWDHHSTPSLIAVLVADTMVYINAALNPVFFLWRMRDVRRACKKTLKKMLQR